MGKLVNLRRARKDRAREAKRAKGGEKSTRFGVTKAEKRLTEARTQKADRLLDGHKLTDDS